MCLLPVNIVNPKLKFSQAGGHPLTLSVPCGHCAECSDDKTNEYQLRSHYEALDTFNHGGFIINDTLTYSNEYLPHMKDFYDCPKLLDFPCFNRRHLRLFFVRLRRYASKYLSIKRSSIKYFLTSEYGIDDRYSHRPHYHVLFFISDPSIDPVAFSELIARCWPFGRTDGVPYKGRSYFFEKRCFQAGYNNDLVHLSNVAKYVAKYMTKDSEFQSVIDERLKSYMCYKFGYDWSLKSEAKEHLREVKRTLLQFHLQSNSFGISALKYNNYDDVFRSGMLAMTCSKNVVKHIPLPTYFKRKLFYTLTKDFRGQPTWELNSEGVRFKSSRLSDSIARYASRMASWYDDLPNISSNGVRIREEVSALLRGRSWHDFALYIMLYKGRLIPYVHQHYIREGKMPIAEPLPSSIMETLPFCDNCVALYYDKSDHTYNTAFPGDKFLPRSDAFGNSFFPLKKFHSTYMITQNTYLPFVGFDNILNLYVSSYIILNELKQKAFDYRHHLKKLYADIFGRN